MKCKLILRYGLTNATKPPLGSAVNNLLKELKLRKTHGGAWESAEVDICEATAKLSEIMKLLANPKTVPKARGRLKYLWLYLEVL